MHAPPSPTVASTFDAVRAEVIGRERQVTTILAALAAGRDLLLEGPPGTSKSTILRSITRHYGLPLFLVEGNAELTPAKLIGYHNPASVMSHGYRPEDFVPGPLPEAMSAGGFLYIEEFNRVPEDTLNVLLTALAERELTVPRVGTIRAAASFRIVGAMNPFDNVGTSRVSISIYDRMCRLAFGYQDEEEERRIVALRTGQGAGRLVGLAVALTRATRRHPDLRIGSSVRGGDRPRPGGPRAGRSPRRGAAEGASRRPGRRARRRLLRPPLAAPTYPSSAHCAKLGHRRLRRCERLA